MQHNRETQASLFSNALDFLSDRLEACPHGLHEEELLLFGKSEQLSRFCGIRGGSLLAQNVFSGKERISRILVVQGVRGANVDSIDLLHAQSAKSDNAHRRSNKGAYSIIEDDGVRPAGPDTTIRTSHFVDKLLCALNAARAHCDYFVGNILDVAAKHNALAHFTV